MSNLCIMFNRLRALNQFTVCFRNLRPYHACSIVQNIFLHKSINNFKDNSVITSSLYCDIKKRYKHRNEKEEDSDTEDEDDGDLQHWINSDKALNKISKVARINVPSLRLDLIVKAGMNVSRNKIEVAFYESKLRLNGNKITKKSAAVHVDDEIDIIKGSSPDNPSNLIVSRVEILDIRARDEKISVIVRKYKALVIENYETPWAEKIEE